MAKYTEEQRNTCSKEMLVTLLLSMQDQVEQMNRNYEKLSEQLAGMNSSVMKFIITATGGECGRKVGFAGGIRDLVEGNNNNLA